MEGLEPSSQKISSSALHVQAIIDLNTCCGPPRHIMSSLKKSLKLPPQTGLPFDLVKTDPSKTKRHQKGLELRAMRRLLSCQSVGFVVCDYFNAIFLRGPAPRHAPRNPCFRSKPKSSPGQIIVYDKFKYCQDLNYCYIFCTRYLNILKKLKCLILQQVKKIISFNFF